MQNNLIYFIIEIILEQLPISSSGHIQLFSSLYNQTTNEAICSYLPHLFLLGLYIPFLVTIITQIINKSITLLFKFGFLIFIMSFTTLLTITGISLTCQNYTIYPPLWLGFLLTTITLFLFKKHNIGKGKPYYHLTFHEAILLGIAQACAFLPGLSRMATILLTCSISGYTKENAFYIAIISNSCISLYSCINILYHNHQNTLNYIFSFSLLEVVYMQIAFFIAIICFYIIKYIITKNKITIFYWYELFIALVSFYFKI